MFKSLREKLKSWLGKDEEKPAEAPKKTKEKLIKKSTAGKKAKEKTPEKRKKEKLPTDKQLKEKAKKIEKEAQKKFETGQLQYIPDTEAIKKEKTSETQQQEHLPVSEEKPSFLSRIFGKKEKPEIKKTPPVIQEEKPYDKAQEEKPKEKIKEQILESLPEEEKEKKSFFSKLTSKFTTSTVTKEQVENIFEDLEIILLENNVALEVVDKIKENLLKDLVGIEIKKSQLEQTIIDSLKSSIEEVLIEPPDLIKEIKSSLEPYTIIFFGINGTGKTTTIAKLANKLKSQSISVVLVAADTFRAAAIEQLETHANKIKVPIIKGQYNSDPTSVAFDGVKYAEKHKIQAVLIDTAGRMYTKDNLIKQMEKIIRVIKPNKKFFVGESIAGNDAIEQAKTFNEAVGIDGIILSKADVDEKAGTVLSVSYVTKKPIYFLGTGQDYDDLQEFKKSEILKNLGLN